MLLIYVLTYKLVGQPVPISATASSPWQLTERVQFSSSPPGLQGRVYPQSSSSNVLSHFLVLQSSLPGYTLWQVSSGNWLIHTSKACLLQWSWQLLATRYVRLRNSLGQVFECHYVPRLLLGVVSRWILVTSQTTSLGTECTLLRP